MNAGLKKKIEDTEKRIAQVEGLIADADKTETETKQRLAKVRHRWEDLGGELQTLRQMRQRLLATGEDVADVTAKLKAAEEARSLCEDEAAGLEQRIAEVLAGREEMKRSLDDLRREPLRLRLRDAGKRYNELAAQLAQVVEEMWTLRFDLNDPGDGAVVAAPGGWVGSLSQIPRVFIVGEEPVPGSAITERAHHRPFCDFVRWRQMALQSKRP